MSAPTPPARQTARRVGLATLTLAGALVLAGCGASPSSSPDGPPAASSPAASSSVLLGPDAFADAVAGSERFVVNVHTPDEGSIAGTDVAIPFDELRTRAGELPDDTATPLAIYCRSGSMSEDASRTLASLGYTNVVDLRDGMVAWTASGRDLLPS